MSVKRVDDKKKVHLIIYHIFINLTLAKEILLVRNNEETDFRKSTLTIQLTDRHGVKLI